VFDLRRALVKIPLVVALAAQSACMENRSQPPIVIEVVQDTQGCRIITDGRTIASANNSQIDSQSADRRGIIVFGKDTSKSCVDIAVTALKRSGISTIDLVRWHGTQ
jgi:hypothetical protein